MPDRDSRPFEYTRVPSISDEIGTIHMAGPDVTEADIEYVLDALRNGWYGDDAYFYVEAFEKDFAKLHDRRHGLMTPNCTTAIHLVLEALGVGADDDVLVPESTWIGSSAGIRHAGAREVFMDVEDLTWCSSERTLEAACTDKTRAAIVVDLYGNMPDWNQIEQWSAAHGIPVIEDAAEALGGSFDGRQAGNFGIASVFSFHRTKTLTTGEGGIILTDDQELFERCRFLRDHGRDPGSYFNTEVAFKYMPSNLMGSLAYGQLQRIEELTNAKRRVFHLFSDLLSDLPEISLNPEPEGTVNGAWATAVVFSADSGISGTNAMSFLAEHGIPSRPFFYPLSSLPAYADNNTGGPGRNPIAYDLYRRGLHLPCSLAITDQQVEYIAGAVRHFVEKMR